MAQRNQEETMGRAADRFASAVEEFSRQVDRLGVAGREPLSEKEAAKLADEAVHEVRSELWASETRKSERPPLTAEEIRDWERCREKRRENERQYEGS